MTNRICIDVNDLAIGYGRRRVGSGISFSLSAGEVLCLLGPNGSGKSTLFKTVLGLLPLQGGHIQIDGEDLSAWSRGALARYVAYVPQAHTSSFAFSVLDVVLMGRGARIGLFASPGSHDADVAHECLERLGIVDLARRIYTELSGGERQLVLIARALAQEPQVLILDEPTSSLDFGNQIRVLDHIHALRDQGLAIFLCTHQPEHALKVADRVALFKAGRLHGIGQAQTIVTLGSLAWLYDLPPQAVHQHLNLTTHVELHDPVQVQR